MGYVPKFAREFSKEFATREKAIMEAAASDPSFDPFKVWLYNIILSSVVIQDVLMNAKLALAYCSSSGVGFNRQTITHSTGLRDSERRRARACASCYSDGVLSYLSRPRTLSVNSWWMYIRILNHRQLASHTETSCDCEPGLYCSAMKHKKCF